MFNIKNIVGAALSKQVIPSFVSIGLKFLSGFGLFFIIGKTTTEDVFAEFVILLSIATFISYFIDFGFLLKLATDFPEKGINRALLESYIIRFVLLLLVIIILLMVGAVIDIKPLLYLILLNVVIGIVFESTSIQLRYQERYWLDVIFILFTSTIPLSIAVFFLLQSRTLDFVYSFILFVKLLFLVIVVLWVVQAKTDTKTIMENVKSSFHFSLDSLLLNIQPLLQLQVVSFFLPVLPLGFFAYGQKIIQGFTTLFAAFNNVFFPKLVKAKGDKDRTNILLKNFVLTINILPALVVILLLIRGTDDAGLLINDIYEDYFFNLFIIMAVVFVRFNSAAFGGILTANGYQKFRVKINLISISFEFVVLIVLMVFIPTPTVALLSVLMSSLIVLFSYIWVVKNEEIISCLFTIVKKV